MSNSVIRTEKMSFTYSKGALFEHKALKDINIDIEKGELIGLIGHTGSGKSTLIQHFNGLMKPTEGKIFVMGEEVGKDKAKLKNVRFTVGLCFQYPEYQLFEETVEKDIAFGPSNMGLSAEEIKSRVIEAVKFVGLDESYLTVSPFDLSGGEKRRVAIAGVMAMRPEVLVLDEPCAGLDPRGRDMILELIKNYRDKTGSTVIIVSHSMEDIAKTATKVLVLNKGEVAYYGSVREVYSHGAELKKMGLNIPEITSLLISMKERGYDVRTDIYTLEEGEKELLSFLGRGKTV